MESPLNEFIMESPRPKLVLVEPPPVLLRIWTTSKLGGVESPMNSFPEFDRYGGGLVLSTRKMSLFDLRHTIQAR